ncbi:MAG: M23 family metallopeptidase [Deltaproteobacteria bacterium]|nr:M23 family metallopeptidase [Deltaproteobacteria bacterium]
MLVNSPVGPYVQITEVVQRGSGKRKHTGLDIKAELGTLVVLPFAGVVTRTNWSPRSNGNCVEVRYARGEVARFLHLHEVDGAAAPGVRLAAGACVGSVGSTGHSIAPHLHYELRSRSGEVLDPFAVHGRGEAKVPPARQSEFAAVRANYWALLGDGLD